MIDANGGLRDLTSVIQDVHPRMLDEAGLNYIRGLDVEVLPLVEDNPRIGPCINGVGKFVGVGLNYFDHAAEAGMATPEEPILFMKAVSSIAGPDDPIVLPAGSVKTDWEAELGVVIGSTVRNVPEQEALSLVAGYCTVNDVSERAYQLEGTGQWLKGKSCDSFGPIGPWLVTRDEVEDPQNLDLWLEVNGERKQEGSTAKMIFSVAHIVSYISRFMTLYAGDIIATGTPRGVGMGQNPPQYLKAGDSVSLEVAGMGLQRHLVVAS